MRKKFKGFTLIECIVAMTVLGVSSALLVQAYAQLARVTRMSNTINNSISLQMADAENTGDAEGRATAAPQVLTTTATKRTFTMTLDSSTINSAAAIHPESGDFEYTVDVRVFAVKPFNNSDVQLNTSTAEEGMEYRYVYFHK